MLIAFTDKKIDSDIFINKAIKEYCILYGISPFSYEIIRKNNEKPFIVPKNLYFNLSHSKNYTVCAVSQKEVGIDIQYHDNTIDMAAITKKFLNKEITDKQSFFEYFVKAEANAKMEGKNLYANLHNENNFSQILPFFADYSLAIASSDNNIYLMDIYE